MKKLLKFLLVASLFVAAFVLGFMGINPSPHTPLKDLASLEALKERFNEDKGVPRVILLVSPT